MKPKNIINPCLHTRHVSFCPVTATTTQVSQKSHLDEDVCTLSLSLVPASHVPLSIHNVKVVNMIKVRHTTMLFISTELDNTPAHLGILTTLP